MTSGSGNLSGLCSDCGTMMFRRVSLRNLTAVAGDLRVSLSQAEQPIRDSDEPSSNSDLNEVA
jgi:hypothetical protein